MDCTAVFRNYVGPLLRDVTADAKRVIIGPRIDGHEPVAQQFSQPDRDGIGRTAEKTYDAMSLLKKFARRLGKLCVRTIEGVEAERLQRVRLGYQAVSLGPSDDPRPTRYAD